MIKLKNNFKVSVIIPCWNSATTIERAITSCLNQSLLPLEILVCDDGSTDKTKYIIKSINSPLVKWIKADYHSGRPAVPRNRGIKNAKGDWLAFLDGDDEWLVDKLEKQINTASKHKCLAVCSNAYRKINNKKPKKLYFNYRINKIHLFNLLKTNLVICSSMIIHHSLIKKAINFPEDDSLKVGDDYALWLRISCLTNIIYLNKPLVVYTDEPKKGIRSMVGINPVFLKIMVLKDFIYWLLKRK